MVVTTLKLIIDFGCIESLIFILRRHVYIHLTFSYDRFVFMGNCAIKIQLKFLGHTSISMSDRLMFMRL